MNHLPNNWIESVQRATRRAQDHPVLGPYMSMVTRLPSYARLGADLARDPDVPASAKASLVAAGAYAISPIDLVPGFIPVAGQLDDLAALLLAIRFAIRMTPKEVSMPYLERSGLSAQQIDDDLRAVKDATFWLARRAANGIRDFTKTNWTRLGKMARLGANRINRSIADSPEPAPTDL
jgi:uncharacterized membrane protein YkvA (DUF1232 family)